MERDGDDIFAGASGAATAGAAPIRCDACDQTFVNRTVCVYLSASDDTFANVQLSDLHDAIRTVE